MAFHRPKFRPALVAVGALLGTSVLGASPRTARADNVSPTGKGIAGGALLGAEVVTITEALAGARPGWAYGVGALVGAGGGGVGGYFIEHGNTDGKVPMYMLAGGLALVIPAIVLTLNATRYMPEEGATEDRAPTGPDAEPGVPGTSVVGSPTPASPPPATPPPTAAPPASPPQSLLDMHMDMNQRDFRLGVPLPDVLPVFSMNDQRQYGMRAQTELRMPVLRVTF